MHNVDRTADLRVHAHGRRTLARRFLYSGNAGTLDIGIFESDLTTGALTPVGATPLPGFEGPCYSLPLTVTDDRRFLFAAVRKAPWTVCGFSIDARSGALAHVGSAPLADNVCYLSTDRTGRFLFSASYQGAKIAINRIEGGTPAPPHQVIATDPKSHSIQTDASNRFALSACLGGDKMYQWRFDETSGLLSPNDAPFVATHRGAGPRHFVFHPRGDVVFLLNELDGSISVFDYDAASGQLTKRDVVTAFERPAGKPTMSTADLHVTPDGRILYATSRQTNTIARFRIAVRGDLAFLGHTPTEPSPRGFAITNDGRWLYCAGQKSNRIAAYSVDPDDGDLLQIGAWPTGVDPNWIEIVDFE